MLTAAQMVVGLAMLYFGAEWMVRGASSLASRMGVSALAIGLTVVSFGTSAPELVVSLDAALSGANDISVGNVVGSNIANIALILGVAALVRPIVVHAKIIRIDAPLMIAVSLILVAVLANREASRIEGLTLVIGLIAYCVFTFRGGGGKSLPIRDEIASVAPRQVLSAARSGVLLLTGFALLVGGGHLLVTAAVDLAASEGISQAAIGLTIVAVGTSLPELATSVIASLRGQGDIAIGNAVGSNLFNILGILGLTASIRPLGLGEITWLDLGMMVGLACFVTILIAPRLRLGRIEGGVLFTAFILYSGWRLAVYLPG